MLPWRLVMGILFTVVVLFGATPGSAAPGGLCHRRTPFPDLDGAIATRNGWVVVDPRNDRLIRVGPRGRISTLAVFPPRLLAGRPIPLRSVPSAVVRGPDGAFYVGERTRFPRGQARVWRVVPGQPPTVYASGFTAIRALSFGPGERLFVSDVRGSGQRQPEPQPGHPGGGQWPRGGPGQLVTHRQG